MENTEQLSLEQIRGFLQASQEVRFEATQRGEVYRWVTRTLFHLEYCKQKRSATGSAAAVAQIQELAKSLDCSTRGMANGVITSIGEDLYSCHVLSINDPDFLAVREQLMQEQAFPLEQGGFFAVANHSVVLRSFLFLDHDLIGLAQQIVPSGVAREEQVDG